MNGRATRPRRAAIGFAAVVAAAVAVAAPGSAAAYPPEPSDELIRLGAVGVVCESAAPYIEYRIDTDGFPPEEVAALTATLTVLDSDDVAVEGPLAGQPLTGRMLYPGAAVDADGVGSDWPGWKQVDGEWVEDPTDAHLRSGLKVNAVVNPEVTAAVQYPPESAACMNPPRTQSVGPQGIANTGGSLPSTGASGPEQILLIGAIALGAGLLISAFAWRRRETPGPA